MMRSLLACAAVCVAAAAASAANPSIESALGVFNMVGNDPGKLNTYCEMSDVEEAMGDREDPAAEAQIDAYINQLGPDFEAAFSAAFDAACATTFASALACALAWSFRTPRASSSAAFTARQAE